MREPAAREPLPVYPGFEREVLPAVLALWIVLLGLWAGAQEPIVWALIAWTTVTTLMLWPLARTLGLAYRAYRRPLFVLGVLATGLLFVTGLLVQSPLADAAKLGFFLALPFELAITAVLASLARAIGRPLPLLFRPDLLFGDGRVLCSGTLALFLGIAFLVGATPSDGGELPVPRWNWWGVLWAIALGLVPLVAIRGWLKLLLRLRRLRDGAWFGWGGIAAREGLLVVALLNVALGFDSVLTGRPPLAGGLRIHDRTWAPELGILVGILLLVVVRGAYKRAVGEPFIRETTAQTAAKELLYVAGASLVLWSLASILDGGAARARDAGLVLGGLHGVTTGPSRWVGLALVAWAVVVLVPFRMLAQDRQRQAVLSQLLVVLLPRFHADARERVLRAVLVALSDMSTTRAAAYFHAVLDGLDARSESAARTTKAVVRALAERRPAEQERLVASLGAGLSRLSGARRSAALAELLAAALDLPEDRRRYLLPRLRSVAA